MPDSIARDVEELFMLLDEHGIRYVLVGGVAMLAYVDGRNTEDVDLIMASRELDRLPGLEVIERDMNFAKCKFGALRVDVLLAENALFRKVLEVHSGLVRFAEREVPTATPMGLAILKLYALPSLYRGGDFSRVGLYENDIATLMQYHDLDAGSLLMELTGHLSESDLAAIGEVLDDIRARLKRFGKFGEEPTA